MDIIANDIKAIREQLRQHLEEGHALFAYNVQFGAAAKQDLHFFPDQQSFEAFAQVHNTERALYFEYSIKHVLNSIEAILDNKIDFSQSTQFHYADGVYSIYDPMQTENLEALKKQLEKLGIDERLFKALNYYVEFPQERFDLVQRERNDLEKTLCLLHFERHPADLNYVLSGYDYNLRIYPEIPDVTVNGISALMLDEAMKTIDWSIDHHQESLVEEYEKTKDGNEFLDRLETILREVDTLYQGGVEGKDAAERLMYKHWYGEPWEPTEISIEHVCKIYEWKKAVDLSTTPDQSLPETYEALKENALLSNGALPIDREALANCLDKEKDQIKPGEELVLLARHWHTVNIRCLETALFMNGWDEPLCDELQWHFNHKSECFDITINKEVDKDKMQCRLQFEDAGNGWYVCKQYESTLYHHIEIEHAHIGHINTGSLDEAMKKADWYYEYSESSEVWNKGFAEVRKINEVLDKLCKSDEGRMIATQLWNNHVPLFTIAKPVIIRKCEEEKSMYPTRRFTGETPVSAAHTELKSMVIKNQMHRQGGITTDKEQATQEQIKKEQQRLSTQTPKDNEKHQHRQKIR